MKLVFNTETSRLNLSALGILDNLNTHINVKSGGHKAQKKSKLQKKSGKT